MRYIETIHTLNAVTASTTGQAISCADAERIVIVIQRSNHSAGSSAFAVDVSVDGTNWMTYNKLIDNVTNTNAQQLTRVAGKTLSSDTFAFLTMDPFDGFPWMRVKVTETTDGTHDAWVTIQY